MKLTHERSPLDDVHRVVFEYTNRELARASFDQLDRALFHDVSTSDDVTLADYLLALERVARRIEEDK